MRIGVEEQNGHRGHRMVDTTDAPMPSVTAGRPVSVEVDGAGPVPVRPRRGEEGKPPYRVPSMAEIADVAPNGLTVASTFAGCGGSCLGYRMAGYRILWANEFEDNAAAAYRENAPTTILDRRDIRTVQAGEILEAAGLAEGDLDLFDGSPPCQSFSMAGQRNRSWGRVMAHSDGTTQRSDDLFGEYVRLLRGLRPRVFVAENVAGMTTGVAKGYFLDVLRELRGSGYRVKAKVLDAQWLGVPQRRQRLIFVGVRADLAAEPVHPVPWPWRYTLREALPWIGRVVEDTGGFMSRRPLDGDEPAHTVLCGGAGHWTVEDAGRVVVATQRPSQPPRDVTDEPAPTVVAGSGRWGQWTVGDDEGTPGRRKFTIAELRRVCSFPDDFVLPGSYAQQWARLGNSVPPFMARAVGEVLARQVLLPAS